MQRTVLHVFVSSTWLDLQPERAAVEAALQRLRETKLVGMEYFGSRDEDTRYTSLDEVDCSQVYVGIFGGRYGSGITEAEYRRARELGLPCFIYLKDVTAMPPEGRETDPEKATLLAALKAELLEHHTISTFTAPGDLAARVTADLHCWLFDEYLRPPAGIPFQTPTVPRYFVPRPEVSQALMDYLTADALPGALVVSAVHGLGGIGKTTLVAALAHAPDVQARFPDGVLWATLGQQPDVLSLLAGWIQALGDYDFHPIVVESASARLRTLLHNKACLLVVDDAWQADHVRPFLVGGSRCRLVVTTRNATLARKVGARLYDLDVMTEAQALALFQARLGPLNSDHEQAAALAHELGYLPLALELAAAQVEAGVSWTELLDAFRQAQADLAVLDLDEATYRNESLRLSFRLSLEQLSPDDRDAFAWLGVLPEDVCLNPTMAATPWDQPEADARKRLRRLRDRALLKSIGGERYTLHDLLHDEAKLRLAERMPLLEAQAVLLARYRQKAPGAQWHRLPGDGYIHEHLTWHMEQAGQPEAIHALLQEETAERKNGWYQARDRLGQTAGYLADVARAWRLAEEGIGLQCRYVLITASLNSLARNIPPALLAALVKQGMWPPTQGLAYACQVPDPRQRVEALAVLASHLLEPERAGALGEALAATWAIESEDDQAKALAVLAPHLPEATRAEVLGEALTAVRAIESEDDQVKALAALAPHLPEALLGEALEAAQAIIWKRTRVKALIGLAPHLPEPEHTQALHEALEAMRAIWDDYDRTEVLTGLVPHLLGSERTRVLQQALATAQMIEWEYYRAEALTGLVPHLPEPERTQCVQQALKAAQAIENEWRRVEVLTGLAPHLPESERMQVLQEAVAAVRTIKNERRRVESLTTLAPHLSKTECTQALQEALDAARAIWDKGDQVKALTGLAIHLPETKRVRALKEVLDATRAIADERDRAETLVGLAPHLPEALVTEALNAARKLSEQDWMDRSPRAEALLGLAPRLAELGHPEEALDALRTIKSEEARAKALVGLAPYLPEALLTEALAVAWEIEWERAQAKALAELALRLAELGHPAEALGAVRGIKWERARVEALALLAPRLAELGHPAEALAAAREIRYEDDRAGVLVRLASHLPEAKRAGALREALTLARAIESEQWQAKALAGLVSLLAELGHLEEALVAAGEIRDADDRAKALALLAPRLAELGHPGEALATAREIEDADDRAKALALLAPQLAELGHPGEALATAREIEDADDRAEVLANLVSHLAQLPGQRLYPLWQETLPILAARTRKDLLADLHALGPVIAALGGVEAVAETFRAIQDVGRWWP